MKNNIHYKVRSIYKQKMGFGAEFYINGKYIDSSKEKGKFYYLCSNEPYPIEQMNICYNPEADGYNEIRCAIKIGYIDGNTEEIYVCKYLTKEYCDNTYVNMNGVLIVIVYFDTESFPDDNEFKELFKKELDLYYYSNFGYPTDYDQQDDYSTVESDDVSYSLLGPMKSFTIASENESSVEIDMCCD